MRTVDPVIVRGFCESYIAATRKTPRPGSCMPWFRSCCSFSSISRIHLRVWKWGKLHPMRLERKLDAAACTQVHPYAQSVVFMGNEARTRPCIGLSSTTAACAHIPGSRLRMRACSAQVTVESKAKALAQNWRLTRQWELASSHA